MDAGIILKYEEKLIIKSNQNIVEKTKGLCHFLHLHALKLDNHLLHMQRMLLQP